MIYGTGLQMMKLIVPFIMRTIMIYLLGIEYLGLNSLFTSILSVLNLAELGVGSAMVYSMYRPIVDDNEQKICALMKLYKIYYRIIGAVVCVLGLILVPFLPKLISGDIPADINIYFLYLLNLATTVLSYWLYAYKSSILLAHQRNDIVSKATLITDAVKYILQLSVILLFRSYYLYVIAILITQILNNFLTAYYAEKMYPQYHAYGEIDKIEKKKINHRIRDLFTAKVGTVIVYSSDTIVISACLGLEILAIYQNYYYLFSAISALLGIFFTSIRAGLGNSIIIDSKEKIFRDFRKLLLISVWTAGFCSTCFLCLYQPFIELWIGRKYLLKFGMVICLSIYFFVNNLNVFLNSYKDASGMWHVDRFRPLVEAAVNLILNLILVQYIGLYGIVISTIISMIFVAPWLVRNLFHLIFGMDYVKLFLKRMCYYVAITSLTMIITYWLCSMISLPLFWIIVVRLLICILICNSIFLLFYHRLQEFSDCWMLMRRLIKTKINLKR